METRAAQAWGAARGEEHPLAWRGHPVRRPSTRPAWPPSGSFPGSQLPPPLAGPIPAPVTLGAGRSHEVPRLQAAPWTDGSMTGPQGCVTPRPTARSHAPGLSGEKPSFEAHPCPTPSWGPAGAPLRPGHRHTGPPCRPGEMSPTLLMRMWGSAGERHPPAKSPSGARSGPG